MNLMQVMHVCFRPRVRRTMLVLAQQENGSMLSLVKAVIEDQSSSYDVLDCRWWLRPTP